MIGNPREVITLHFGQAGIQIGNAVWETMITEHDIKADGLTNMIDPRSKTDENSIKTFFHMAPSGQFIPRTLLVDTEPSVIDEIRTGFYRKLFHPDLLLSGLEDAANNFARGFFGIGRKMLHQMIDKTRFIVESCDNFKGFMTFSGSGGGTGSGLYSLFLDRIMLEFCGKTLFGTLVLGGKTLNDTVVDPYNSVFRINQSASSDLNLLMDNESMYKICYNYLNILRPTYANLNRLLAPILSSITAPFRFQSPLASNLSEITMNLIPYPKINFPTLSYSPFISQESLDHTLLDSGQLLRDVFQEDHCLLGMDLQKGKFISSVLTFRGQHKMNVALERLSSMKTENIFKWVDWCPTGFKMTQTLYPVVHTFSSQPQSSILMICNHSEITNSLQSLCEKFSKLFRKQSFVHWYVGEGMEINEMVEAIDNIIFLQKDYEEVCKNRNEVETFSYMTDNSVMPINSTTTHRQSESKRVEINQIDKNVSKIHSTEIGEAKHQPESKGDTSVLHTSKPVSKSDTSVLNSSNSSEREPKVVLENKTYSKPDEEYEMTARAKEIIFNNVTTLSPELRQRMFGFVE